MGAEVVVVDEKMDTRPICDTQAGAEGGRERLLFGSVWPAQMCHLCHASPGAT